MPINNLYHEGELAVQQRVDAAAMARMNGGAIDDTTLDQAPLSFQDQRWERMSHPGIHGDRLTLQGSERPAQPRSPLFHAIGFRALYSLSSPHGWRLMKKRPQVCSNGLCVYLFFAASIMRHTGRAPIRKKHNSLSRSSIRFSTLWR